MASIPLPALDLKPPAPPPDALQQVGRIMQLKQMMQNAPLQNQALQQQVQAGGLENQQRQMALNDQKAMTTAMQQWDGKDLNQLPTLVLKNGGSAQAVMGLKAKSLEMQQTASRIAAEDATTGSKNIETLSKKNDAVIGALNSLKDVPDDQLPQAIVTTAQQLVQQGLLDQQHAQQAAQIAQSGNPQLIRPQLESMAKGMMSFSQVLDQAKQNETSRHNSAIEAQTAATSANTQAYQQARLTQNSQRLGIESARLRFQQAQSGITPNGQPSPDAQAIASGHIVPERMSYLLARNPEIINSVVKLDPSFDSSKAQAYPATYKDFTSGKTSVAINAGGTALSHLQELSEMNTVESHIPGTPDYNAYQNKADTVASELAKFYGDATIPAIASIKKTLTSTLPGNRQAAIQTQAQSMGDKLDSYAQQWENAAPSKNYQAPMPGISPKAIRARAALDPKFKASGGDQPSGNTSSDPFAQFGGKAH